MRDRKVRARPHCLWPSCQKQPRTYPALPNPCSSPASPVPLQTWPPKPGAQSLQDKNEDEDEGSADQRLHAPLLAALSFLVCIPQDMDGAESVGFP